MPSENEPPGSALFEAVELRELARNLRESGPEEFGRAHPHPVLILERCPPDASNQLAFDTQDSNPGEPGKAAQPTPRSMAVPLIKSNRNVFESRITVGRARNNDIVIRSQRISKVHASFQTQDGAGLHLVDMGSVNGTGVNGARLKKGQVQRLRSGDRITFWRYEFRFLESAELVTLLGKLGG